MNIRKYLLTFKRKLFAGQEYDERLQRMEDRLAAAGTQIQTLIERGRYHTLQLACIAVRAPRTVGKIHCLFVINNA